MGYTTDFDGEIAVSPPLNADEVSFLRDLANTRRMNRTKGPLYISKDANFGQDDRSDVIDYNQSHPDQPGLWLCWEPSDDGTAIAWDGTEKFYDSAEWMRYLVEKLLTPSARAYIDAHMSEDPRLASFTCDHELTGIIDAQGEDPGDRWQLGVTQGIVGVRHQVEAFGQPYRVSGKEMATMPAPTVEGTSDLLVEPSASRAALIRGLDN